MTPRQQEMTAQWRSKSGACQDPLGSGLVVGVEIGGDSAFATHFEHSVARTAAVIALAVVALVDVCHGGHAIHLVKEERTAFQAFAIGHFMLLVDSAAQQYGGLAWKQGVNPAAHTESGKRFK